MYRQNKNLDKQCRKLLCSALIQPLFDYASPSWYNDLSQTHKNKLQTTQNKMIRFINQLNSRSHVGQTERREMRLLNVANRVTFLSLCNVYKHFNELAPSYMHNNFTLIKNFHQRETRSSTMCNYRIPIIKGCASKTFYYNAIKAWNRIPCIKY